MSQQRSQRFLAVLGFLLAGCLVMMQAALASPHTAAENPAVNALIVAWNTGATDLGGFLTEDVTYQGPFNASDDLQGYRNIMMTGLSAFREVDFKADDLILDGDRGALSWTATSVHNASGRAVRLQGVSILRFKDGKIAAEWRVYDGANLLRQIGAMPGGGDDDGNASSE